MEIMCKLLILSNTTRGDTAQNLCSSAIEWQVMKPTTSRPDFTGMWEVNVERSVLRGPAPKRILAIIEHQEPRLIQQLLITNVDGIEQRMTFSFGTDAETSNAIGNASVQTLARWEGTELVIESRMKTPGRDAYFKDHWSLSEDGQTLTMAHRDDDLAGQISVLEKKASANT
jgi:hypothetical protein